MYLLGRSWQRQKALWSRLETDALALASLDDTDAPRMRDLMEKYRDLPMDLADAALVRVAERDSLTRVFTLDRKLFSIYRPGRGRRFSIVPLCRAWAESSGAEMIGVNHVLKASIQLATTAQRPSTAGQCRKDVESR
jgi:hypothetical protein